MKDINNNDYLQKCCPTCKSIKYFEIRTGTDGLFSSSRFSHYKCETCQADFRSEKYIYTVDAQSVKRLIQAGIKGDLHLAEMIRAFRKMGVHLVDNKPAKKKVTKKKA